VTDSSTLVHDPAADGGSPLLRIRDLSVETRAGIPLLTGVDLSVAAGTTLGVVGESGSGKSLTALSTMGLLPTGLSTVGGSVHLDGVDLLSLGDDELRKVRGRRIGMILQDPQNSLNPAYTIGSQLIETVRAHDPSLDRKAARRRSIELLERVGIPHADKRMGAYPHEFSGGMAQRVMVALAISSEPDVLIADEPTTALDVTVQAQILSLLRSIQDDLDMTLVLISHDLAVIAQMADEIAVMYAGEVIEQGPVAQVLRAPGHPYTAALLAAQPDAAAPGGRLATIRGGVPEAGTAPSGCRFRPRCDFAVDACAEAHPEMLVHEDGLARCIRLGDINPVARPVDVEITARPERGGHDEPLLRVRDVTKTFRLGGTVFGIGATDFHAVADASFEVYPGETVGIVGESGAGKSTLGRVVLGLEIPSTGSVEFLGRNVHQHSRDDRRVIRRRLSVVFQNPFASLDPSMSVGDSIVEPVATHLPNDHASLRALAKELLEEVGLPAAYVDRRPHELSGGQRQRVAIARALSMRPDLVVCDEAVSALDVSTQAQVLNLLADLQDEHGTAFLFVGHDLAVVNHVSDRIVVMHQGRIVEMGTADDIYERPAHPYTQALLGAVLTTDVDQRQITAAAPTVDAAPSGEGCSFATRCPHVRDECLDTAPTLVAHDDREVACHVVTTAGLRT
jgi:oligopeptide/dipeptide ABC transporter ATP-binding protein